jgi:outer membrane protein
MKQLLKLALAVAVVGMAAMPAAAQQIKIGVVNIPALVDNAPQTKAAMDALQEEFAPRQRALVAKQKEFEDLTAKVQKDLAVMGETERKNAEKNLRELQREVSRLQNELGEDFNLRRNEELGELQRSIFKEVQDYALEEGYDLVVGDGVLFASGSVNITEQVLRALESSFQATSAN